MSRIAFWSFKSGGKCEKFRQGRDHLVELKFGGSESCVVAEQQRIQLTFKCYEPELGCKKFRWEKNTRENYVYLNFWEKNVTPIIKPSKFWIPPRFFWKVMKAQQFERDFLKSFINDTNQWSIESHPFYGKLSLELY